MLFLVSLTAQQVINDGKDGAAISGDSPSGPDPVGGNKNSKFYLVGLYLIYCNGFLY